MERAPKGTYFRDTWDWLGSDACFGHCAIAVTAGATKGLALQNISTAGEYFDVRWVFADVDNAANFRLIVTPAFNASTGLSNPQVSYVNVIEGGPPLQWAPIASPGTGNVIIYQTAGTFTNFQWPQINFGTFVRVPANWYIGVNITAGASNTALDVAIYGQFIQESDVHTGAALAARGS